MPIHDDDQQRVDQLRAALVAIGLTWNWHYCLINEGPWWRLDFLQPMTPEQHSKAQVLLSLIMNN
jgi:hypothetical protein